MVLVPSIEDQLRNSPWHFWKGKVTGQHIQTLLDRGGDLTKARHIDGKTPLMCIIQGVWMSTPTDWAGQVEQFGMNPNGQDLEGRMALHYVLARNTLDVASVQKWMAAGADPKI